MAWWLEESGGGLQWGCLGKQAGEREREAVVKRQADWISNFESAVTPRDDKIQGVTMGMEGSSEG